MPEVIVYLLELVDIKHGDTQGCLQAIMPLKLCIQRRHEMAAVSEPGKLIGPRQRLQMLARGIKFPNAEHGQRLAVLQDGHVPELVLVHNCQRRDDIIIRAARNHRFRHCMTDTAGCHIISKLNQGLDNIPFGYDADQLFFTIGNQ